MPRGGKRPGAGRPKGVPNKATSEARAAFTRVYEGRLADLDRWIGETGDGFEVPARNKLGQPILDDKGAPTLIRVGKDPGKASDILTRMAEHFVPKLQRLEKGISDASDEELLAEIRRRKEAEAKPDEG